MDKSAIRATLLIWIVALSGCVTPKTITPARSPDFTAYKTIRVAIHLTPNAEVTSGASEYAQDLQKALARDLAQKLPELGYTVVPETAELNLDIAISAAKAGNRPLRFWIGSGAGRGAFKFRATFTNGSGAMLGAFDGGGSYLGFWLPTADEYDVQRTAVEAASKQIERFLKTGTVDH